MLNNARESAEKLNINSRRYCTAEKRPMIFNGYLKKSSYFCPSPRWQTFFKKYEPPISSRHSMSQAGTLRGLQEKSQFERILEKEVGYEHKVNNFDAYPTNGPERSPAKKSGNLSISQFAKLKKGFSMLGPHKKRTAHRQSQPVQE